MFGFTPGTMRLRSFMLALAISMSIVMPPFAARAADRALLLPVDRLVAGINAGSASRIAAAYVAAPTIVDELAPFRWSGEGAARQWLRDFAAVAQTESITHGHVVRHVPTYVTVAGGRAWVVVPADFHYEVAGKAQSESAAWTFVLVRTGGVWRIEASTWAKTAGAA